MNTVAFPIHYTSVEPFLLAGQPPPFKFQKEGTPQEGKSQTSTTNFDQFLRAFPVIKRYTANIDQNISLIVVSLGSYVAIPLRPPKTVFICDLSDPKLSMSRAIPVSLEFWPECVTALSYDLEEFGVAESEFAALNDLRASIRDLYFLLKEDESKLGPLPRQHWKFLKSVVQEK